MNNFAKIILRSDFKKKDGTSPICLRLTFNKRLKIISLQKSVFPHEWDSKNELIKGTAPDADNTNLMLRSYLKKANEIILDYCIQNRTLTFDDFELEFRNKKTSSYYEFVERELAKNSTSREYAAESMKTYSTELTKLKNFRKNLTFDDITISFLESYEAYMRNRLGNKINTVHKSLKCMRTFINKAIRQNLVKENVFRNYRLKTEAGSREFLSLEELQLIENYYHGTENPQEKNFLKVFLFGCYTGLRFRDITNLKFKNIDQQVIRLRMHKTNDFVVIPVIDKSRALMPDKGKPEEYVFDVPFNQTINRSLKVIMKKVGITKSISFHCARHTFATLSLTLGIRMEVVSKLLGHKDIKVTQIYAKVVDSVKIEEMTKWNLQRA